MHDFQQWPLKMLKYVVLSCPCVNACKRSLACLILKSRPLSPGSRLPRVPIKWYAHRGFSLCLIIQGPVLLATDGVGKWINASTYMSLIGRFVVHSACFDDSLAIYVSPTCSHQYHQLFYQRLCHVLSCLCDKACERSPAIFRKSRASCPVSRLLSVPI